MSAQQQAAARKRYWRESQQPCTACGGSGLVRTDCVVARAKKGGNANVLVSLLPHALSMSDRGRLGGRPKELVLTEVLNIAASLPQSPGSRGGGA